MANHNFNFDGGEHLRKMGAGWFVSYSYYNFIDKSHMNWNKVEINRRKKVFEETVNYHKYWLQMVLNMNNSKLNTNKMGLKAETIKDMAKDLLAKSI